MQLRPILSLLFAGLALTACSVSDTLDMVGNESSASANKIREMAGVSHKPAPPDPKVQPRYCYKTFEDVICYSRLLPASEDYRLVGYQTLTGKVGYVVPEPDEKSFPKPEESSKLLPIKTVAVPPPSAVKGDSQLKEVIFDPAELEPKELVPEKIQ